MASQRFLIPRSPREVPWELWKCRRDSGFTRAKAMSSAASTSFSSQCQFGPGSVSHQCEACFLPSWLRRRLQVSVDDMLHFRMKVVPMGWNWAVWFMQQAMEHTILARSFPEAPLVRQFRPSLPLDKVAVTRMIYIDNFAALSLDQAKAKEAAAQMLESLTKRNIAAVS